MKHSGYNIILALAVMASVAFGARAEDDFTYKSGTEIDLGLGVSYNISNYKSEDYGAALFSGRIGNPMLALRVNHFFSRHWGAYFKAEWMQNSYLSSQKTVLDKLHAKDDGYDYITPCSTKGRRGYAVLAGAVYRFDKLRWSLRPMLAVGVSSYNLNSSFTAYRKQQDTNHMDAMLYAVEQDKRRGLTGLVISPTIEASLHVTKHMDFFCSLAFEYNTAQVWQRFTITDTETGRELDSTLAHEPIGNNIAVNFGVRYVISLRK
ncbi:MAG: hypothetical protein ACI4UN_04995 [Muribaculaceae bacterium]